MKFTDDTPMPFGIHKGKRLADVPDDYLLWLYENNKVFGDLKPYIIDNLEAIRANVERMAPAQNEGEGTEE